MAHLTQFGSAVAGNNPRKYRGSGPRILRRKPPTGAELPFATDGTSVHYHAVAETQPAQYFGARVMLRVYALDPTPGDMTLGQLWMVDSTTRATAEVGWMIQPQLYTSGQPTFFLFYNPDGYGSQSHYVDVNDQGPFTPAVDMVPGAPFTALPAAGVETTHGFGVSFDASSSLIVWTTQSDGTWVQVGSYSPGAYDGINFDVVQFGWEVAGRPNCGGMGTGAQPQNPDTDLGKVAYFLKAEVQTELGGEWTAAELTGASDQEDTSRGYLIATGTDPDWGSFAFGGGPK